jgi:hypothetical protein
MWHVSLHLGSVHRPQAGPHDAVHVGTAGGGVQLQQLRQFLRVHRLWQATRLQATATCSGTKRATAT